MELPCAMRIRSDSMPQSRRAVELPKTVSASAGVGMRACVTHGDGILIIKARGGSIPPPCRIKFKRS